MKERSAISGQLSACEAVRVFLIGYRGSGKSTVARALAERLGWEWIDSDDEVERVAGKAIAAMFAEEGEPAFRELEERVVAQLCGRERCVVALGGGAVLREATRRRLAAAGPIVWLVASAEVLAGRIAGDTASASRRPALSGRSATEEVALVLAAREPIYRGCATVAVEVEGQTPDRIAEEILGLLRLS